MEFHTDAQRLCYEKVKPWLKELFGELAEPRETAPIFTMPFGSALVNISITPWGEEDATIRVRAFVVTKVEIVPDLALFLLRQNDKVRFGAFGLDGDDDIFFDYTIVGSSCQKSSLKAAVFAVARTADEFDDPLVARFGGERAVD